MDEVVEVKNKKTVSIGIVSYNTGAILGRSIDYALKQKGLSEVIIVNNGNPSEVLKELEDFASTNPKLQIISGHGNIGFAAGCNKAAKKANGDYILLLNPDCLLPENALVNAIFQMEKNPKAWMCGCKMLRPDGTLHGGSKRNLLTPQVAFSQAMRLYRFGQLGKFMPVNITEDINDLESSFVPAISGAFMMMPLDKYWKVGGMDEEYFFHVEDLDLCLQINKVGGKILYIPSINLVHYQGSSKVSSFFVERNKTDGFIRYFKKNYGKGKLFLFIISTAIYCRLAFKVIPLKIRKLLERRRIRDFAEKEVRRKKLFVRNIKKNPVLKFSEAIQKPVLLTGATGQVGLNIMRRTLENGAKIYGLFNKETVDYRHENLSWIHGDLASGYFSFSKDNFANEQPHTLIHTPAIWLLPEHLERFASLGVKRLICFSSTSIIGKSSSENPYEKGMLKQFIQGEKEVIKKCEKLGIEWTIFRPTMIYGSGLDRNISSIVRFIQAFKFFPIAKPGKGIRQPVHVDDLALAILQAIDNPKTYGKTYNLCGGEKITYCDMVKRIFSVINKKERIFATTLLAFLLNTYSFIFRKRDINGEIAKRMNYDLVFDDSSARADFEYSPRNFLEGGLVDLGLDDFSDENQVDRLIARDAA